MASHPRMGEGVHSLLRLPPAISFNKKNAVSRLNTFFDDFKSLVFDQK